MHVSIFTLCCQSAMFKLLSGGSYPASRRSAPTHRERKGFRFMAHFAKIGQCCCLREESMLACVSNPISAGCRIADDKRQAAASAVQSICSSKSSLVVTLRQPVAVKPQLKRKRSTTKALEAARNSM